MQKRTNPYELFHKKIHDMKNLKVFRSLCFVSTLERDRFKLESRAKICLFLGYKDGTKGYITLDVRTREVGISINVIFLRKCVSKFRIMTSNRNKLPLTFCLKILLNKTL